MKIKFFVLASMLLALAACNAPQEKATEAPVQQPVQVSEAEDYQPIANPLKKEKFAQINIVVGDIYKAAKAWAAILDIPVPEVRTNHLEYKPEFPYTYRGEPSSCDLLVCDIDMGSWVLELHQADDKPSSFREFYDKHGNGVHHLGFEVGDLRDEVIQELQALGFNTDRTFGAYTGSSWTIVDSEDILGVNLNIKPVR
jgi:hypothetical protein